MGSACRSRCWTRHTGWTSETNWPAPRLATLGLPTWACCTPGLVARWRAACDRQRLAGAPGLAIRVTFPRRGEEDVLIRCQTRTPLEDVPTVHSTTAISGGRLAEQEPRDRRR
jgi:hypothetical protein